MTTTSFDIKTFKYDADDSNGLPAVVNDELGKNWPVVYLIYNNEKLYVGETQDAANRFQQHWDNLDKKKENFQTIAIIFDKEYNKSAILDIEQTLIQLFEAQKGLDINAHKLTNRNGGQSEKHNYYQREKYQNKVDEIWNRLQKPIGLARMDIGAIRNSDLFKYSPYNTLTPEQERVSASIIRQMIECLKSGNKGAAVIKGGAGTGKSIVMINMIYTLMNAKNIAWDSDKEDDILNDRVKLTREITEYLEYRKEKGEGDLKIGFVVPMSSIRGTFKTVFSKTNNKWGKIVIGPYDVTDNEYDVVFVDETHRLKHRNGMITFDIGHFDKLCKLFGLNNKSSSQLDLIVHQSKFQVLVYDENQAVKRADIEPSEFDDTLKKQGNRTDYKLQNQMRCKGGRTYTEGVNKIFECSMEDKLIVNDYEFKLYYDPNRMIDDICTLDKTYGLCRSVAGYSWEWVSKKNPSAYDVKLSYGGTTKEYKWNSKLIGWILKGNPKELGCIHTTQGYDLNYVGVIFGSEIDYDPKGNKITINKNKFHDIGVKRNADDIKLRNYIINAYKVMMMRGIKGCYIYAVNDNLRDYLEKFIPTIVK